MRAMIDDFRIAPAGHCGSGSMRNLIYHYCHLDLEEGVVFGLGAGLALGVVAALRGRWV